MYLVAQRVVTPSNEGINTYLHMHGDRADWVWSPPADIPDQTPGQLVAESVTTRGMGRVASFLDIAAPDGTTRQQLWWAHDGVFALMRTGGVLPLQIVSGQMLVRFEVEFQRRPQWHEELHHLLDTALALVD
jgi:hypothetical protein